MTDEQVRGMVAVITGAASGIGAASAARLADQGWTVHALDRAAPTSAVGTHHRVDVTDDEQKRGAAEDAASDAE